MREGWLKDDEWRWAQEHLPLVCVDVLPYRKGASGLELGLILRATPTEGERWCLVGGRLLYGESIRQAIGRQLTETLGEELRFALPDAVRPAYIAEYAPEEIGLALVDARQHAVGLTFPVEISGRPVPGDEASDFRWFPADGLPGADKIGFGQMVVIQSCVERI